MQHGLLSEVDASNSVLRSLSDSCEEQGTGGRLSLQVSSREAHPKKFTSRSMQGEAAAAEARHHEVRACQEGQAH